MEKLRKASAWYVTAYRAGTILSFGWIMNYLMCDIRKMNQSPQEEHQAWKRIGQAMRAANLEETIRKAAFVYQLQVEEPENVCNLQKLGWQFLTLIDKFNETALVQNRAHKFLMFLHRVALQTL